MTTGHWATIHLFPLASFTNPATFPIDIPIQQHEAQTWLISKPDWPHRVLVATLQTDTNFEIRLGTYVWRVHSDVLSKYSRFFSLVVSGNWQETQDHCVYLHDDEPWMVGRTIQFFYTGSYDYTQARFCKRPENGDSTRPQSKQASSVNLSQIMQTNKHVENYTVDKLIDRRWSATDTDIEMYIMADKYGIAKLRNRVLNSLGDRKLDHETLIKICTTSLKMLMNRDDDLKRVIAQKVADSYKKLRRCHSEWVENWIRSDAVFGLLVLDCMEHVEEPLATTKRWNDRDRISEWNCRPMPTHRPPTALMFPTFSTPSSVLERSEAAKFEPKLNETETLPKRPPLARNWSIGRMLAMILGHYLT
ncbi:hypothetical protein LTR05_000609 [Lithohypha guttulata]|uniref:BTB domain-containing protein n=1 Tax=Lithohypha guttulata TaxID=1690604 RepID=A0AAN7YE34_9EURO|nr:hypothetical protein LTR05_000609 [Lithohypha guttulata]